MQWEVLTDVRQVEEIQDISNKTPVLIYKHSSRCSISAMVLERLKRNWREDDGNYFKAFFLYLIAFREASNAIASVFNVEHESPQILIINKGQSVYDRSHYEINYQDILRVIKN